MITGGKTTKRSKNAMGRQESYKPSQQKQGLPGRDSTPHAFGQHSPDRSTVVHLTV